MAKNANKTMESNHKLGTVLATGLFLIVTGLIAFPLLAGLTASFRPAREIFQNGMSLNLNFNEWSLHNYSYLFTMFNSSATDATAIADSQKYFMWYKNSLVLTITTVVLTLLVCYFVNCHQVNTYLSCSPGNSSQVS